MLGTAWELPGLQLSVENRVHRAEKGLKQFVPAAPQICKEYKCVHSEVIFVKIII